MRLLYLTSLKVIIILAVMVMSVSLIGQTNGTLSGRVTDKVTSESLIGVNIFHKKDMTIGTVTDFNGYYSLSLAPGTYTFTVSYTGMKSQSFEIKINDSQNIIHNIQLEPFSTEFDEIIIRAGKFDKAVENQTVSIEIMSPRLIDARNTESVETILDMVPGLNILDEEPQIRGGSGFTFGVGSKVAVFITIQECSHKQRLKCMRGFIQHQNHRRQNGGME